MRNCLITLFLSFLFIFSCVNPFLKMENKQDKKETNNISKTGSVKISFSSSPIDKSLSRTIVADFSGQITNWKVTITKDGITKSSEAINGAANFNDVAPGIWSVILEGRNSDNQIISEGNSTITISVGVTSNCVITPKFKQTGTGGFLLALNYPALSGVDYVSCQIVGGETYIATIDSTDPTTHKAVFKQSGIPSGGYELIFTFRKGGATGEVAGTFREAINIWDNTVSDKFLGVDGDGKVTFSNTRDFTINDFSDRNANLSTITITNGILNIGFNSTTQTYEASITADTITINPVQSVTGQIIKYNWRGAANDTDITSGSTSASLSVNSTGNNILLVKVTSPDRQNTKTYTFNCVRRYRVIYNANNANSGSVPIDNNYYAFGESVSVLENTGNLTKTDKRFMGWNLQADALGLDYDVGNTSLTMGNADKTLYARWGITYAEAKTMVSVTPPMSQFQLQGKTIALSPFEIG
ncbi:MAG TPA: cadherin-like beta sandwich domain-containing protein, partial [Spirochaetota bacterium]|nr:cadherin-like beta sandwich domain-containing protein [Spirochaetota bacterium]